MNRRTFLSLPLVAAAARAQNTRPEHPNIVVFLADDLGWADVGFHGSEIHTPNLDRLAKQGARLERFYSFPVCSPTRSALMTGRSPIPTGILYSVVRPYSHYGLPVQEHILPQTMKAAGYQTAILGKWHLGHAYAKYLPNSRGFDHAYGHVNGAIDYFTHERDGGLDWYRNGKALRETGYTTELLADEAVQVIRDRDKAKPLFLYMPFNAPHSPLQAPERYLDKYANIRDPKRKTFAAMVDALDAAVGKVLQTLEDEKMTGDTLVLFFSDNGGPVNLGARNTPLRGAKATAFEGGIRVPAVMRWPGKIQSGTQVSQVMTAMDMFPTLAAAAGVTPGNKLPFDGKNMWPGITGGKAVAREDLFFGVESGTATYLAVLHGEWKLVREIPDATGTPRDRLFRIEEDPTEAKDFSAQHPDLVKDLIGRIQKWQALYPPSGIHHSGAPPAGYKAPKVWIEAARPG